MPVSTALIRKITEVEPPLREILLLILEEMEKQRSQWEESVTKTEFNELKEIVRDLSKSVAELVEAQKRTEDRLNRLEQVVAELAEAQKRTEARVAELAEAQKRTEKEITKLTRSLSRTRQELGGLSRSMAYALENEAYCYLPTFLKKRFGLELIDHLVRTYIDGEEVNIFGKAKKEDQEVYLVGEAVLKLDDPAKLKKVWKKVEVVKKEFGGEVIPILVTHFARPEVLEKAQKAGIIVVQSFEWIQ